MALTEISKNKIFGGFQKVFSFKSTELECITKFGVYLPPQAENTKLPVIYYLSGLSCSEANFIEKSGVQKYAAEHGIIIVNPDTSPRGLQLPGETDNWDFGEGAGFYIDATQDPWKKNYRMYSYVTKELIDMVNKNFPVIEGAQSIMGHSMGGHGAIICSLKYPTLFKSVSAFAPICNPSNCPWGVKAFTGYLGSQEVGNWESYDATELAKKYFGPQTEILIDQGLNDKYLNSKQLLPENLIEVCKNKNITIIYKERDGYDHSYFYIASFIEEHIKYHAGFLKK